MTLDHLHNTLKAKGFTRGTILPEKEMEFWFRGDVNIHVLLNGQIEVDIDWLPQKVKT